MSDQTDQKSPEQQIAEIRAKLRPYAYVVGRSFSGSTFRVTAHGGGRKQFDFVRQGQGNLMIYRFKDIEDFEAHQNALTKGTSARINFGIDIDLNGTAEIPAVEPAPQAPSEPEVPQKPDPLMLWREARDNRRQELNRATEERIRELVDARDLSIGKFEPKTDQAKAILDEEWGTEESPIWPGRPGWAPEVEATEATEAHAEETVSETPPPEVETAPAADDQKLTYAGLKAMDPEKLRELGASRGFTGKPRDIIKGLLGQE